MFESKPLLILGAFLGLAVALGATLVEDGATFLPSDGEAARVNERPIASDELTRALEALAADKRNPITEDVRAELLERLIEEELLVQRGLEIGLAQSDRSVRKSLVNAMISYVLADRTGHMPTDDEIAAFFAENKDYFARTERLHIRRLFVRDDSDGDIEVRLEAITGRLVAGEPFEQVVRDDGDAILPEVPDGFLPVSKLRDYLGPTLAETALSLPLGSISEPIKSGNGHHFLFVVDIKKGETPALATVRDQVVAEYNRRSDEQALRDYLAWLKSEADIVRQMPDDAP